MFGEEISESPRQPSPWRQSSYTSPSPLTLGSYSPLSAPGTPDSPPRSASRTDLERIMIKGLANSFESLQLDGGEVRRKSFRGGLRPEVDKSGHIEYKLRLPSPSSLRLEKLRTQLKWRLVEGGGTALYELGVMDDGRLIGLRYEEMQETLSTLGRMLAGLGGGDVRINRVVRIQSGDIADDENVDSADPTLPLFPSFDVGAEEPSGTPLIRPDDCALGIRQSDDSHVLLFPSVDFTTTTPTHVLFTGASHPIEMYPSAEEDRALCKRNKRDERRLRRESDAALPRPRKIPIHDHSTPKSTCPPQPKSVKLSQSAPAKVCYKPQNMADDGEARYAIEAVVEAIAMKRTRRRSSMDDEEEESGEEGGEGEGQEGWSFLEFDFVAAGIRRDGGV